jgi:hypothetical protein
MNINILIDAIVRQTTVLIAQLATTAGARATLSQTANQVFLDLVTELKEQGLGNKLIADMFGLTLRTYHNKMRRLAESSTERGESLWNAVLAFVQQQKTVTRGEVLARFCRDDERTVRSVLSDLVATGMVFSKGTGDRVVFRAASPAEYDVAASEEAQALSNLLWITIARHSPISRGRLLQLVKLEDPELDLGLEPLLKDQRVSAVNIDGEVLYRSEECVIPVGESAGWEASVFDHYQAMVIAICSKLRSGAASSVRGEALGGSTYGYEVWPGHPLREEVMAFLQVSRDRAVNLRERVDRYNQSQTYPKEQRERVIAYVGQTVLLPDEEPIEMESL